MKKLPFIVLDLETTGLNPQVDTIIEIAAIKFDIIHEDNSFRIENPIERTMLINPGRPLEEEVTLITHITDSMLEGRETWDQVRQRVADFIGMDSIILGHNVLFDISMLATHGIDLSSHKILDTFEISEIFSQEASSLNLGFLGDLYNIQKRWQEHRALTDTWISADLFVYYLQKISNLQWLQKELWHKIALQPQSPFYAIKDFFWDYTSNSIFEEWKKQFSTKIFAKNLEKQEEKQLKNFTIFSLENNGTSEYEKILEYQEKYKKLHIITINKKIAEALSLSLQSQNISNILAYESHHFVYAQWILEEIAKNHNNRKYTIFLLKMIFWLTQTKTGRINELKYYGDEYTFVENFRLQKNESNIFRDSYLEKQKNCNIIIESFHKDLEIKGFALFKDIALMEWQIRHAFAHKISFEKLVESISNFSHATSNELIQSIRMIEAIYENVPKRPTWENPIPPGKYGETYFFSQNDIWSKGCKWLSLGNKWLFESFDEWKKSTENITNRNLQILRDKIIKDISMLISYETQEYEDLGVIITIVNNQTSIEFISQNIGKEAIKFFKNAAGYGYHITAESVKKFLQKEFLHENIVFEETKTNSQIVQFSPIRNVLHGNKILILTTSTKHIRELWAKIKNFRENILLQWISGGKSKMKHYFGESGKSTVLIGLIDSWRDEGDLLKMADTVIIAKIPFDPPTDPYFLAKTIGMSNSFEIYSKPLVLSRLNTLIGNALSANPHIKISCTDERIVTTEWGKFMKENLF